MNISSVKRPEDLGVSSSEIRISNSAVSVSDLFSPSTSFTKVKTYANNNSSGIMTLVVDCKIHRSGWIRKNKFVKFYLTISIGETEENKGLLESKYGLSYRNQKLGALAHYFLSKTVSESRLLNKESDVKSFNSEPLPTENKSNNIVDLEKERKKRAA